jgi:hypothetical protein
MAAIVEGRLGGGMGEVYALDIALGRHVASSS